MQSKVLWSPLKSFLSGFFCVLACWIVARDNCRATEEVDLKAPRSGFPNKRAVVNFAELARQQAEHPDTNRVARSIHPPMPRWPHRTNAISNPLQKADSPVGGGRGPL